ncbi:MAG: phosphoribosylformylglycinamidine cyclo-ligase [Dehalococcoides mccartyi]|nr:phosphoribosylformylglycinamidine cyclo-ligase [Dehalococcoides mccartyi]MCF7635667.1 phosphoribosylformylglycinamidine cyclo-ligase [Dehalococcoides mccartyi]MEA2122686.1 Phosphoribosylformylglycinamidine cyclo-ligase [Dehalococcoides mccartyi]
MQLIAISDNLSYHNLRGGHIKDTYAGAGVDINSASKSKELIKQYAKATLGSQVLAGPGFFGGMYEFKGYKNPVLVSSCDGVGTKLKLAGVLNKHDTIGIDIVNHSVNDILTSGAEPIFFLDYIAMGKLSPEKIADIVKGLSTACLEAGCALIGGETAEMPGLYHGEDYDLAGFIVGVVEKENMLINRGIKPGDVILGLASNGLHTNGYSLARKVLGESREALDKYYPELGQTAGEALLVPHRSYLKEIKPNLPLIKGLAHITGGGLTDNVPRTLPEDVSARFETKNWEIPPLFQLIQKTGGIDREEMFHVFNMGIGMVIIAGSEEAALIMQNLPEAKVIGEIAARQSGVQVIIE